MNPTKNIGIWIRVSTDMQVLGDSPEHHEKRAILYAESRGWNVVTIYRLEALSGKSVMEYSETKRMLKDIADSTITGLIFSKLARLARNTKELLELAEIFRDCNADLISLAESIDTSTPAGRLFYTMIAAMAQWEREEIAERVAASVPIRAKLGKSTGGSASYGYKWQDGGLVLDDTEAPIRKLIYEIFLQTRRKKATAQTLNEKGYRTRNGSKFTDTTIDRLLKDPTAKGTRIANYTKSLGEKKHWKLKPKEEWVEVKCPQIVSEDLWNECNALLTAQYTKRAVKGPKASHLLSGLIYCDCGSKMYVYTESPTYKCKKCKRKIEVADIDTVYHEQLKSFFLTNSTQDSLFNTAQQQIKEKEDLLKVLQTEYEKLYKQVEIQANLRVAGELSKEDFAKFYKPSEQRLRQIEKQLPDIEAEIDFQKIQALSLDAVIVDGKDLYSRWTTLPFEEKRSIIEEITNSITIHSDSIDISLAYLPTPNPFPNPGKKQRFNKDSLKRSA